MSNRIFQRIVLAGLVGSMLSCSTSETDKMPFVSDDPKDAQDESPESRSGAEGPLKAIPFAVGGGQDAVGGRGGRVVVVNTTEDIVDPSDSFVSLREAIMVESGPRNIVFAVGGVFETGDELFFAGEEDSYVTLACQTAPEPGVIIKSKRFTITHGAHDVVMTHCTNRGTDFGQNGRSLLISGSAHTIYAGNMSLSWASDENFQIYDGKEGIPASHSITLANSMIIEGDADSSHPQSISQQGPYYHSMGPSCNSNSTTDSPTKVSMTGNFMAHNAQRNGSIYSCEAENVNSVVYNWGNQGTDAFSWSGPGTPKIKNNFYKAGPQTQNTKAEICGDDEYRCAIFVRRTNNPADTMEVEISDNYFVHSDESVETAALMRAHPGATQYQTTFDREWAAPTSVPITELVERGSDWMNCVGASKPTRDVIDERVIEEFYTGTGAIGIFENDRSGGHNVVTQRDYSMYQGSTHSADYDTDNDGMDDNWERARGLVVGDIDHSDDDDNDGFTNLEEFFADIGECR